MLVYYKPFKKKNGIAAAVNNSQSKKGLFKHTVGAVDNRPSTD